jgi:hypothetical protein
VARVSLRAKALSISPNRPEFCGTALLGDLSNSSARKLPPEGPAMHGCG